MSGVCFQNKGEQQTYSISNNKKMREKLPNMNRKFMIIIVMRNAVLGGVFVSVDINVRGFIPKKRTLATKIYCLL